MKTERQRIAVLAYIFQVAAPAAVITYLFARNALWIPAILAATIGLVGLALATWITRTRS